MKSTAEVQILIAERQKAQARLHRQFLDEHGLDDDADTWPDQLALDYSKLVQASATEWRRKIKTAQLR